MPCFHPLDAHVTGIKPNGKKIIKFGASPTPYQETLAIPCGQCIGCRLTRSRDWAVRCVHEASLHEENCFITLTYNDDSLPLDNSLNKKHYQDFMKRLRFKFPNKIRFFHCGEYGEKLGRPHYHACLFGHDFPDKIYWKTINGQPLFRSAVLEQLWPFGFSSIGTVTFESAAYVARYILKKINGEKAHEHYQQTDQATGEILKPLQPEYTTMSRKPGIASGWLKKYMSDVYPSDEIILKGKKLKPPRYYDNQYELIDAPSLDALKSRRKSNSLLHLSDNTPARLRDREKVKQAQLTHLIRPYEAQQNEA